MQIFPHFTIRSIGFALLRITLLSYVIFVIFVYFRQDTMLYFPDQTPFAECAELINVAHVNMGGTRGYFFQNGTSTKLAVLYHGNGGRACERAFYRTAIEHAGYSWLIVEYTGYAGDMDSRGNMKTPNTESILRDVEHVREWVEARQPETLAIIGESIGSGLASYHALLQSPDSLILLAPFDRLSLIAQRYHPFLPVQYILHTDFDNIFWAAHAKRVLIVHGDADTIVPISHAKNLFSQLPQQKKEFLTLPGVDHNESFAIGKTQYAILQFLKNGTLVENLDK